MNDADIRDQDEHARQSILPTSRRNRRRPRSERGADGADASLRSAPSCCWPQALARRLAPLFAATAGHGDRRADARFRAERACRDRRGERGRLPVTLPGTTAAFAAANIYARATGYIAKRNVDIGDHVKQGELLAELAVPELDEQISQNEATLEQLKAAVQQAQANATLAQATWGRDKPLLRDGWVTGHQGDIDLQTVKADEAAVGVAQANVAAQERLLRVLRQNRAYASVVAPFDGVITQRNVDVGALVQGNANTGTFMFEIMQKDVIRVWVYVPQDAAFGLPRALMRSCACPKSRIASSRAR